MVVDDEPDLEPLIRQKFRRQIRDGAYEFVFACNGLDALSKLIEFPEIGIILSDINMPEMDGLTLLTKLKELKNPGLKTVIVSAYGDMDNIRTAMNRGAFDFLTKPISFDDLEITISKTMDEILHVRKSQMEHDQLLIIRQDLNTAREIQAAILPKNFPPFPERTDFSLFASMIPAREVGGDFYDYFMIDNERLGFVIGDVSGKGVPAAIFMAVSRTLIRATGLKGIPPEECMNYVNSMLCNESVACMFVTVFYGILNARSGELQYVNCGHNPPFLISGGEVSKLSMTGGTILGCIEGFNYRSSTIVMKPGDRLFLYTDGVTEAFNPDEIAYGEELLIQYLKCSYNADIQQLITDSMHEIEIFQGSAPQSDDITYLALEYRGTTE